MKRTQDPMQQRIERLRDSCSCNHHRKYSSLKLVLFLTETLLRGAGVSAHCPALLPEWNNAYSSLSTNSYNILLFSNSCQRETDKNRQQQQKMHKKCKVCYLSAISESSESGSKVHATVSSCLILANISVNVSVWDPHAD